MPESFPFVELQPMFIKRLDDVHWKVVPKMEEADGVEFICPKCYLDTGKDRRGVHSVICWEPQVPLTVSPGPGRWSMRGTGLHDLSLVANSSSIHLQPPGCGAHFFVRNGQIEWA